MADIFIRTNLAPYRIDTYNAFSKVMGMKLFFYRKQDLSQNFDIKELESACLFEPHYLNGIELGASSRKVCFGLYKLIKHECPNYIIIPEFQIVLFQLLILRILTRSKFKIISMSDDSFDMIINDNSFTKLHKKLRAIVPRLIDDIIVVEPRVRDWYFNKFGIGIWLPIIRNEKLAIEKYRSLLPLSNTINQEHNFEFKKILLFVGRLVKLKNIDTIIAAFSKCEEDAILVIIGDGPEKENLIKKTIDLKKTVLFTGRLEGDELYAWYNISDILILLSTQEAFGAVTNEALLAGNRVIVSEKAGSSCLVTEQNGAIVKPFEIDSISEVIDKQLRKIENKSSIIKLKPNLMGLRFDNFIEDLKNKLQY